MTLDPTVMLDLKTAIAYDFFMSHVDEAMQDEDQINALALVAQCGFHLADVFVAAQEKHKQVLEIKFEDETNE